MDDFKTSEEYEAYCRRTGRTSISFSIFCEGALKCKCIRKPSMRVCVDEVETGFTELVTTLRNIQRSSRAICDCRFCQNENRKKDTLGQGKCNVALQLNIFIHYNYYSLTLDCLTLIMISQQNILAHYPVP